MTVRTNVASLAAQRNVALNESAMNEAVARVSSGIRINKISVDASGFAVATKITADINTLTQARRNAAQGGSVAQVAAGGMTQVSLILQRMKTLSAQVTSGALSDTERAFADAEYQKLIAQIGNIATQTRFNGTSLIGGGSSTVSNASVGGTAVSAAFVGTASAYTGNLFNTSIAAGFSTGYIEGTVQKANTTALPGSASGALFKSQIKVGDQTFEAIHNAPTYNGDAMNGAPTANLLFVSTSNQSNVIAVPWNVDGGGALNIANGIISAASIQTNLRDIFGTQNGQNAQVRMASASTAANVTNFTAPTGAVSGVWAISSNNGGKFTATDGETTYNVTTTSNGAQSLSFANGLTINLGSNYTTTETMSQIRLDISAGSTSSLTFQVGEKSTDTITLSLDSVTAAALGINGTSITNTANAATASLKLDSALTTLNTALANIGATQSQFEFSAATTAVTVENLTATRGVIEDADIAGEMSDFAKYQVLTQMATAMLAQANQIPQFVLRLMG